MKKLKSVFFRFINNHFVLLALSLPCPFIALNVKMTTILFILFLIYCFIIMILAFKSNFTCLDNIVHIIINREENIARKEHYEFMQKVNEALDEDGVTDPFARFQLIMLMLEVKRCGDKDDKIGEKMAKIYNEQGLSCHH